jgi:hypothetical protein
MKKRLAALVMAFLLGLLLFHFRVPIPFMLSGIISASFLKFFIWTDMRWPVLWRNLGLMAAGYGIGRSFTQDTLARLSEQMVGVFGASFVAIGISLLVAWVTYKHTFANLLSCIMGMLPGGLNQMMLMADEDPRVDANVVVMQQTIRLFGVVVSVPFLVVHLLGASVVPQGLLVPVGDNTGLTWLLLVPVTGIGYVAAKKLKVPTPALIGPILATAAFSIICNVNLQKPPPILMNLAQMNIGLYMGCMLDKERLLRTRVLLPYAIIGTLLLIGGSVAVAEILVRYYGIPIVTAFLAMAPGGMTEMCLAGMSMGADVSIILTYQIVRLLMMNLTVPFCIHKYFDDSYTG